MFIRHFYYGVAVGAVEVYEPLFCDDSCGLGFYKLYMSLLHSAVDCVFGITCNFYNLWHGKSIGIFIKLTPDTFTEFIRQRRRKSSFSRVQFSMLYGWELRIRCYIFLGVVLRVLYVGEHVFFQHGIFSCSLAGVLAFNEAVVQHPSAFTFTDMQGTPHLLSWQHLR